jgi:hypothetical protein
MCDRSFSREVFAQTITPIFAIPAQMYDLPKTVADCFKCRNKIVLEALRESWYDRRCFFLKCDRPASRGAFAKAIALCFFF